MKFAESADEARSFDGKPERVLPAFMQAYGYGSFFLTTRNWTTGFGPCCHLPGFHLGYLFWTHSHIQQSFDVSGCYWVRRLSNGVGKLSDRVAGGGGQLGSQSRRPFMEGLGGVLACWGSLG